MRRKDFTGKLAEKIENYQLIAFNVKPDVREFLCMCNSPDCRRPPLSKPVELSKFDGREEGWERL